MWGGADDCWERDYNAAGGSRTRLKSNRLPTLYKHYFSPILNIVALIKGRSFYYILFMIIQHIFSLVLVWIISRGIRGILKYMRVDNSF